MTSVMAGVENCHSSIGVTFRFPRDTVSYLQPSWMWAMNLLTNLAIPYQFFHTSPVAFSWGVVGGGCLPWRVDVFCEIFPKWFKSAFHPKCPLAHKGRKTLASLTEPGSVQQLTTRLRWPTWRFQPAPPCILRVASSGTPLFYLYTALDLLVHPSGSPGNSFLPHPGSSLEEPFSTSVLQELLKLIIPDYLGRGTDLFSMRLWNKKNDNGQHNNSHLVWRNQNLYLFFVRLAKNIYLVCCRILVISFHVAWDDKSWKALV